MFGVGLVPGRDPAPLEGKSLEGSTAEAWGPTRALRPAQSSHWLNHPDTKGQGSLISALGGGKPPRAQSRREKDGERIQEGK